MISAINSSAVGSCLVTAVAFMCCRFVSCPQFHVCTGIMCQCVPTCDRGSSLVSVEIFYLVLVGRTLEYDHVPVGNFRFQTS